MSQNLPKEEKLREKEGHQTNTILKQSIFVQQFQLRLRCQIYQLAE